MVCMSPTVQYLWRSSIMTSLLLSWVLLPIWPSMLTIYCTQRVRNTHATLLLFGDFELCNSFGLFPMEFYPYIGDFGHLINYSQYCQSSCRRSPAGFFGDFNLSFNSLVVIFGTQVGRWNGFKCDILTSLTW